MKLVKLAALLAATTLAAPVFGHATLETQKTASGSSYKGVMRIGHGCDGQATLKVRIDIPEGVIAVKPMPKAGWTLETETGDYEHEYNYFGTPMASGVKRINWTGELSDDHYDEFVFKAWIDESVVPGQVIYFPTVQECADGREEWVNKPAAGQDSHDIEGPAPGLEITEGGHAHH